jgi:hypothetical protein
LDDVAKPIDVYIVELLSDINPGMHAEMLRAFLARKVYYGHWSITGANLEFRRATSKCPVKRWWLGLRLRMYRRLPNRVMNFWQTMATTAEYESLDSAGLAAVHGRIIRL